MHSELIAGRVVSVRRGRIAPLGAKGVPSAFVKTAVAGPVAIGPLGLAGDQQADRRVHGGADKAVYGYSLDAYARWVADFPEHAAILQPGAFGENLTIETQTEETVCLGDVIGIGDVLLQVCQPRQPCFKLSLRFGDKRLPKAMIRNGRSGWYYRVLAPGSLAAGNDVRLIDRPHPQWTLARFNQLWGARIWTADDLAELGDLPGLAANWRETARETLARADSPPTHP